MACYFIYCFVYPFRSILFLLYSMKTSFASEKRQRTKDALKDFTRFLSNR